jgi:hypothetical protein
MTRTILAALVGLATLAGCAGGFSQIAPGMTSTQVNEVMGRGPSNAREFNDGSVAWFYGQDACIRLREDKVVAKEVSEHRGGINTPWVSFEDVRRAQCAPKAEEVDSGQLNVYTPVGVISAPSSVVKEVTQQQPADAGQEQGGTNGL